MPSHDATSLIDPELEDRVLRAILHYDRLLPRVTTLDPSDFSTSIKARLFGAIKAHWEEFQARPDQDAILVDMRAKRSNEPTKGVERYLRTIEDVPMPEYAWICGRIDQWVQSVALQKALFNASQQLARGNLAYAQDEILKALRNGTKTEAESRNDIALSPDELYDLVSDEHLFCTPTRIYALDDVITGLYRQELMVVMAPLNVGKSWAAVHLSVSSLLSGKRVLYITGEMNRQRTLLRHAQNFSGTAAATSRDNMRRRVSVWDDDYDERYEIERPTYRDTRVISEHMANLRAFGGTLKVVDFPSSVATVDDIAREVEIFDVAEQHPPDVLIVDGLGDLDVGLKSNDQVLRHGLARACRELRKLASDHDMAVVVTHQSNRESLSSDIVGARHTGEALAIVQIADTAISLNQSEAERQLGKMRIYIMRARNKPKGRLFEIYQAIDVGQFCVGSKEIDMPTRNNDDEREPRRRRYGPRAQA